MALVLLGYAAPWIVFGLLVEVFDCDCACQRHTSFAGGIPSGGGRLAANAT